MPTWPLPRSSLRTKRGCHMQCRRTKCHGRLPPTRTSSHDSQTELGQPPKQDSANDPTSGWYGHGSPQEWALVAHSLPHSPAFAQRLTAGVCRLSRLVSNGSPSDGSLATARLRRGRAGLRPHRLRSVDGRGGAAMGGLPPPPSGGWWGRRVRVHHLPIWRGTASVSGWVLIGGAGQAPKVGAHRVPATERTRGGLRIAHRRLPQSADRSATVPEADRL